MVASGQLDGCYFASSYLAARVPTLDVFDRPFQTGSRDAVFAALDGEVGTALAHDVSSATAYRVLGWWDNGIRHISNAVRPIRTPADCIGLRLRTLDNAQHQAAFRRLGFLPIFIDVADLSRAVADRTVDAQENPLTNAPRACQPDRPSRWGSTVAGKPRAIRGVAGRVAACPGRGQCGKCCRSATTRPCGRRGMPASIGQSGSCSAGAGCN